MSFSIYSSNEATIIYRKYIKIGDVIASVGGIIKVVTMVFYYLNLLFSRVAKYTSIINYLFYFNEEDKDEEDKVKRPYEIIPKNMSLTNVNQVNIIKPLVNIRTENNLESIECSNNRDDGLPLNMCSKNMAKLVNEKITKRYSSGLFFSRIENIKLIFKCGKKNNPGFQKRIKLYEEGCSKINPYFDYAYVITKLYEYEDLKSVLLNNDQLYIWKLMLDVTEEKEEISKSLKNDENKDNKQPKKINEEIMIMITSLCENVTSNNGKKINEGLLRLLLR